MADEYAAQGDFTETPYANTPTADTATSDTPSEWGAPSYEGSAYTNTVNSDFNSYLAGISNTPQSSSDLAGVSPGDGATFSGNPAERELNLEKNDSPISDMLKSIRGIGAKLFGDGKGGLSKTGDLAASMGLNMLGELFSGSKRKAAAIQQQNADANTQNANTNASHVANLEAARQNALNSTAQAFGPSAGIIGRPAKYQTLAKPNWKVS